MSDTSLSKYEVTAHHEASHAVVAVKLGMEFDYLSMSLYQYLARPGDTLGGLHFTQDFDSMLAAHDPANSSDRLAIENLVIVAIAGEAGQAFLEQRACDMRLPTARGDYAIVMKLANWLYSNSADRNAFVERQVIAARRLVSDPVCDSQIECVANQLRVLNELSYDAVVAWMKLRESDSGEASDSLTSGVDG